MSLNNRQSNATATVTWGQHVTNENKMFLLARNRPVSCSSFSRYSLSVYKSPRSSLTVFGSVQVVRCRRSIFSWPLLAGLLSVMAGFFCLGCCYKCHTRCRRQIPSGCNFTLLKGSLCFSPDNEKETKHILPSAVKKFAFINCICTRLKRQLLKE